MNGQIEDKSCGQTGCVVWANMGSLGDENIHFTPVEDVIGQFSGIALDMFPNESMDGFFCISPKRLDFFVLVRSMIINGAMDTPFPKTGHPLSSYPFDTKNTLHMEYREALAAVKIFWTPFSFDECLENKGSLITTFMRL